MAGDQYVMTLGAQAALDLTLSTTFDGVLALYTSSNSLVFQDAGAGVRHAKAFLPPGDYKISVGRTSSAGGTYTLSSPATALDGCGQPINGFVVVGTSVTGTITDADCGGSGGTRADPYGIRLAAGQTVSASVAMDQQAFVEVSRDGAAGAITSRTIPRNSEMVVSFTAAVAGLYRVFLIYPGPGQGSSLPINYSVTFR